MVESNSNGSNELIQKIEEDIAKSGLPLEIEISSILTKAGWKVRNQVNYTDKDTNKERQIDIVAHKSFFGKVHKYDRFLNHLIIECKRDEFPWVFFTTPKPDDPHELIISNFGCQKHYANPPIREEINVLAAHSHYLKMSKEKSVVHYEPFKSQENKKNKIYVAKYQVAKCLLSEFENMKKYHKIALQHQILMKPIAFYFPIICFDGNLFKLYLNEEKNLELKVANYIQYEFYHKKENFLIDVVRKDFFEEYLKNIESEITNIKNDFENYKA